MKYKRLEDFEWNVQCWQNTSTNDNLTFHMQLMYSITVETVYEDTGYYDILSMIRL